MSGTISNDQLRASLSGSGALSHVYIQHPPIRCSIPETRGLYYDDGNKLVLSPTSDQVLSWKIGPASLLDPPNSDSIGEGPILSIRYSLDRKMIGIQRSNHEIQFKNRETGKTFSRRCRPESESILGFFWTDCPTCDIVIIKTSGLDLLSYEPEFKTLRLVEAKRLNVSWYVYTHESRMVLLASGMQCKLFSGFQISSGGIIRLPKFEMTMAKSEVNQKPVLAAEDVHVVTIYGRIYCIQVDSVGMLLHMYRFYRDAVVHQGSLPIYSIRIAVSVVDNVLLVHQLDAKVVILYDIFLESLAPISAPLPLRLRSMSRENASSSQAIIRPALDVDANALSEYIPTIYGVSWSFLVPDLICDSDHGILWRIHLDLEAIAASSSEVPSILEFLQRRRSDSTKIKQLCHELMRTVILERRPISLIANAIDVLVTSYSQAVKVGSVSQGAGRVSSDKPAFAGGEKAQSSGKQHTDSSGVVDDEVMSRVEDTHGKSNSEESKGGENEPQQSTTRDVENDLLDVRAVSTMNSMSTCSVSVSDGSMNFEQPRTHSGESFDKSLSGDNHGSFTGNVRRNNKSADTLSVHRSQALLQSQVPEPGESPLGSNVSGQQGSQVARVEISPDEMYHFVFSTVEEEMAGDPAYLVAVIVEFFRSASLEKLKVHPNLYVMTIQLLARGQRYPELGQFIINKILEPSKELALQLLESGRQNFQMRKLGMDMLRQLSLHHDYVSIQVQHGYYLEALRYARKNKVTTIEPSLFLEAACTGSDLQHLAAVLRFFCDFMPGFKNSADFDKYHRILSEIS